VDDGERLIAFFGSEGLYAYDLRGKLLWKKDLGVLDAGWFSDPTAQWETGSSPILHDNVVVIQVDVQKGSLLGAFRCARRPRALANAARRRAHLVHAGDHQVNGQAQLIVNGWRHIGSYDFKTGREVWRLTGGGDLPVPTPVVQDGLIYITNAHAPRAPVYAIRETAAGDITLAQGASSNQGVAWSVPRDGGYMCTPLVYRGLVYIVKYNGVLSAYDAKTGEVKYQQRLADDKSAFTSSPVASDGRVYLASEEGHIYVFRAGPAFELIAENDMGESVLATPAISEGLLIYRTQGNVVAVAGGVKP
jgi:outer membrane protein assembly factor BamB